MCRFATRWHRLVLACGLILLGSVAQAQPVTPAISLQESLSRALEKNPRLASFPHRFRAADAARVNAALRPSPELGIEIENLFGKQDLEAAEITLSLSQVIELGGKRQQRLAIADAEHSRLQLAYEQARLDILGETASRWLALAEAEQNVLLLEAQLALQERALQAIGNRVRVGASHSSDRDRMRLLAEQNRIALRQAERQRTIRSAHLAAQWGELNQTSLRVNRSLTPLPPLPDIEQIRQQVKDAPLLKSLISETRLREAQWQLTRAGNRRDLSVSAGLKHEREDSNNTLLFGISVPLTNSNRGNDALAAARWSESQAALEVQTFELQLAVESAWQQLVQLQENWQLLHHELMPLAQQLHADIERGYQAGRFSLLELINAQQEQLALSRQSLDIASRFHQQRNALERLTGLSFSSRITETEQ